VCADERTLPVYEMLEEGLERLQPALVSQVTVGRQLSRCATIVAALAISVVAHAQQPTSQRQPPPQPAARDSAPLRVTMTVSGGVSLGSYQAGATWAFIYVLRNHDQLLATWKRDSTSPKSTPNLARPRPYVLDVLTGASAGNVNALLAALEYCSAAAPRQPEASLFWKAWTPIGFRELIDDNSKGRDLAVFSRRAFEPVWRDIGQQLARPHVPHCDLLLGVAATKLTPHPLELATGLTVPVQRFSGVFRLFAADSLVFMPPRAEDLVKELTEILILDPAAGDTGNRNPPRLPNGDVVLDFAGVRRLVEASASFPIAFSPRLVSYQLLDDLRSADDEAMRGPCVWKNNNEHEGCDTPRSDLFVDGGVFDNRPLNLALGLSRGIDVRERRIQTMRGERLVDSVSAQTTRDCSTQGVVIPAALVLADTIVTLGQRWKQIDSVVRADSVRAVAIQDSLLIVSTQRLVNDRAAVSARLTDVVAAFLSLREELPTQSPCAVAATRLLAVIDSVKKGAQQPAPRRLMYFIDDDARRPAVRRVDGTVTQASQLSVPARQRREPPAGVAAAMRVFSSAFQTGQNGELRLFANRIGTERLAMHSRFPSLMADHLGHFGAFMAKTFREHDFYAGVYDGLRSSLRELYCRPLSDSIGGNEREARRRVRRCEVAWVSLVITQRLLLMRPEGIRA
jgi:predicted acylesterase/phospholipase RssA